MRRYLDVHRGIAATSAAVVIAAAPSGCGQTSVDDVPKDEPTPDAGAPTETERLFPDAPPLPGETKCEVEITTNIPVTSRNHVEVCTPVKYATNPPSSGDHWPVWAAYKSYEEPVPREMYVHNLEHGAIVLAYKCASGCEAITDLFETVQAEAKADPVCLTLAGGPNARFVVTPDDELDTPIAAAAWGATYTATCIDQPSLARFVEQHYAKGPENLCGQGKAIDEPNSGVKRCDEDPPDGGAGGGEPDAGDGGR